MFHINPDSLVTKTDKLLFNIQELLLAQRAQPEPIIEEIKVGLACKFCGGTHENKGLIMACARKNKRAG
jgi:hypothetical protein